MLTYYITCQHGPMPIKLLSSQVEVLCQTIRQSSVTVLYRVFIFAAIAKSAEDSGVIDVPPQSLST